MITFELFFEAKRVADLKRNLDFCPHISIPPIMAIRVCMNISKIYNIYYIVINTEYGFNRDIGIIPIQKNSFRHTWSRPKHLIIRRTILAWRRSEIDQLNFAFSAI